MSSRRNLFGTLPRSVDMFGLFPRGRLGVAMWWLIIGSILATSAAHGLAADNATAAGISDAEIENATVTPAEMANDSGEPMIHERFAAKHLPMYEPAEPSSDVTWRHRSMAHLVNFFIISAFAISEQASLWFYHNDAWLHDTLAVWLLHWGTFGGAVGIALKDYAGRYLGTVSELLFI